MDKLNELKTKIEEFQAKSLFAKDIHAFLQVVLDIVKKHKDEFKQVTADNQAVFDQVINYLDQQHGILVNKLATTEKSVSQETKELKKEFKNNLKQLRDFIDEAKSQIKDGYTPVKGVDYFDGKDGKDGSPDTGEQIIEKINASNTLIDLERIAGSKGFITQTELDRAITILDQRTSFLLQKTTPTTSGGAISDGDKGDITVSSSGATWTIDNLAVTNAKINDVAWSKITGTPTTLAGYGITDAIDGSGASTRIAIFSDSNTLTSDAELTYNSTTNQLTLGGLTASGSGGLLLEASDGTDVGLLGASNTTNVSWYGNHNFGGTLIQPTNNDGASLGASGNAWSDLFLASGAVINFNAGDVTVTHTSNLLTIAGGALTVNEGISAGKTASGFRRIDLLVDAGGTYTQGIGSEATNATDPVLGSYVTGDGFLRFTFLANGLLEWGSGSGGVDTNLYRSSANTLRTDDAFVVAGSSISGATNDATALGTATVSFADLFLATGGVINWNNGNATLTHSSGLLTSSVDIVVPDEAYDATAWNGSNEVPTKNAVRDKIESMLSGSGITRTVVNTSGSATMGSSASTDYVYFVTGAHTLSLPTASGNTNRYSVKNLHSSAVTIDTAGAENIEGASSMSLQPNDAVDIISDGTNWYVF